MKSLSRFSQRDIEKFWGYVDKERSNTFYNGSRCWEWAAGCFDSGYGTVKMDNKQYRAHRVSYAITHGSIPDGLSILHHCDNRLCVNPSHLAAGTTQDNVDDRERKGRHPHTPHFGLLRGEANGNHKLTDAQVAEILRRYAPHGIGGNTLEQLAKEFGVTRQTIQYTVRHRS